MSAPKTDTDLLRLLLESLRRWQPPERDEPPVPPTPHRESRTRVPEPHPPRRARKILTAHREHPVLMHGLYTYLSVTGLLVALMSARCHS
ncbi:hypothetical protein [Streptomyces niveus]|uniref:hypothetical protein n=1 Tax=Streptomyces niveus TaxID=193462 RepID=UPI00364E3F1E